MSDTRFHDGTAAHEAEYRPREHRQTRWPKPDAISLVFFAVWVLGILVSTVIPFLIVPPTSTDPESQPEPAGREAPRWSNATPHAFGGT